MFVLNVMNDLEATPEEMEVLKALAASDGWKLLTSKFLKGWASKLRDALEESDNGRGADMIRGNIQAVRIFMEYEQILSNAREV